MLRKGFDQINEKASDNVVRRFNQHIKDTARVGNGGVWPVLHGYSRDAMTWHRAGSGYLITTLFYGPIVSNHYGQPLRTLWNRWRGTQKAYEEGVSQ